jgi:hypothetical protein
MFSFFGNDFKWNEVDTSRSILNISGLVMSDLFDSISAIALQASRETLCESKYIPVELFVVYFSSN